MSLAISLAMILMSPERQSIKKTEYVRKETFDLNEDHLCFSSTSDGWHLVLTPIYSQVK